MASALTLQQPLAPELAVLLLIEIGVALYVAVMAVRLFHITQPTDIFTYIYLGVGFAVLNTLVHVLLFVPIELPLAAFYLGSRVAVIGTLVSFALFFYRWNSSMRKGT